MFPPVGRPGPGDDWYGGGAGEEGEPGPGLAGGEGRGGGGHLAGQHPLAASLHPLQGQLVGPAPQQPGPRQGHAQAGLGEPHHPGQ